MLLYFMPQTKSLPCFGVKKETGGVNHQTSTNFLTLGSAPQKGLCYVHLLWLWVKLRCQRPVNATKSSLIHLPGAIWILHPVSACNLVICSPPFPITEMLKNILHYCQLNHYFSKDNAAVSICYYGWCSQCLNVC